MPFFLLSCDEAGDLRLLTYAALPTRQDALAALSKLTAEPDFDAWDDDVLLVDLDSGLPVLLVRPADKVSAVASEMVVAQTLEPQASWESQTEPAAAPSGAPEMESDAGPRSEADSSSAIPTEEDAFASYVSSAAEIEYPRSAAFEVGSEALVAGAPLPVPDMATELEPEIAWLPVSEPLADAGPDEFAAMEGSGATAPSEVFEPTVLESLSVESDAEGRSERMPAEPETEFDPEPVELEGDRIEPESAPTPIEPSEPEEASDKDLREALVRTAFAMEEESLAAESDPSPPVDLTVEKWPWDVASVPVADTVTQSQGAAAAADVLEPTPPAASVPMEEPLAVPEVPGGAVDKRTGASELLMDLEPISPAPEPSSGAVESDLPAVTDSPVEPMGVDGYVCADCVYFDTCPNKDQRFPRDCGSFQWK